MIANPILSYLIPSDPILSHPISGSYDPILQHPFSIHTYIAYVYIHISCIHIACSLAPNPILCWPRLVHQSALQLAGPSTLCDLHPSEAMPTVVDECLVEKLASCFKEQPSLREASGLIKSEQTTICDMSVLWDVLLCYVLGRNLRWVCRLWSIIAAACSRQRNAA